MNRREWERAAVVYKMLLVGFWSCPNGIELYTSMQYYIALFLFPHIVKTDFGRDGKVQLVKDAVELKPIFIEILTLHEDNSKKIAPFQKTSRSWQNVRYVKPPRPLSVNVTINKYASISRVNRPM